MGCTRGCFTHEHQTPVGRHFLHLPGITGSVQRQMLQGDDLPEGTCAITAVQIPSVVGCFQLCSFLLTHGAQSVPHAPPVSVSFPQIRTLETPTNQYPLPTLEPVRGTF